MEISTTSVWLHHRRFQTESLLLRLMLVSYAEFATCGLIGLLFVSFVRVKWNIIGKFDTSFVSSLSRNSAVRLCPRLFELVGLPSDDFVFQLLKVQTELESSQLSVKFNEFFYFYNYQPQTICEWQPFLFRSLSSMCDSVASLMPYFLCSDFGCFVATPSLPRIFQVAPS